MGPGTHIGIHLIRLAFELGPPPGWAPLGQFLEVLLPRHFLKPPLNETPPPGASPLAPGRP